MGIYHVCTIFFLRFLLFLIVEKYNPFYITQKSFNSAVVEQPNLTLNHFNRKSACSVLETLAKLTQL